MNRRHRYAIATCIAVSIVVATFVRMAPLVEGGDRLQRQCVSEDGYLMLTIARNIALGHGFSVSGGMIPSNGTQPLGSVIYALCYWCADGARVGGLYPVVGLQVAVSIAMALLVFVFTRRILYKGAHADSVAVIAAILWYVSPTSLGHSQNSLETGLCAPLILLSVVLYDHFASKMRAGLQPYRCLLLGLLLGITFLGRNDTCFLIAAMLGVHVLLGYRHHRLARALGQSVIIGLASMVVASPWLWFNVTRFGHPVPISGRSEALQVPFAHNIGAAAPAMLEDLSLVARIPSRIQDTVSVQVASAVVLITVMVILLRHRRWIAARFSIGTGILACFTGLLLLYYSLLFGMPCFLGRYFFPAVTLSAIILAGVVTAGGFRIAATRPAVLTAAVALAAAACIGLDLRIYAKGREHQHFQVVRWVEEHIPEDTWVAAVQTGTLGYYHERTINLDGKVDPGALAARERNQISDYVIERNVEYIVDWAGIAEWADRPEFAANYELVVNEPARNLAALRRRPTAVGP